MVRCFAIGLLLCLAQPGQAQPIAGEEPPSAEAPAQTSGPTVQEKTEQPGPAPAAGSPYREALEATAAALGEASPVAVVRPEAIGAQIDLGDLTAALLASLAQAPERVVIGPDEVRTKAGTRFAASPAGLAGVAKRCGAQAVVFLRWIQSSEGVELYPLVVSASGEALLDQTFALATDVAVARPESPPAHPPPAPQDGQDQGALDGTPESRSPGWNPIDSPATTDGERAFQSRRLTLVDHPGRPGGFDVFQAGQAVGELDLARMVARADLVVRIEDRIQHLSTLRSVGIGLTLGGFAAAGLSLPLFKSGDHGLVAGSVLAGLGTAVGVAGAVLWGLYGDEATRAGGADPVEHLLTRDEAEQAVRAYNGILRQELGLPPSPGPISLRWQLGPIPGGLAAGLSVTF